MPALLIRQAGPTASFFNYFTKSTKIRYEIDKNSITSALPRSTITSVNKSLDALSEVKCTVDLQARKSQKIIRYGFHFTL
jgi:hypothetical protein